ncbi:MAG: glutamate--tRNA ligase [Rhodospirillales bacterium]|nr:glutamate--tRNA ligase [Rhodospirillales bacterium]
MTVITRFAPSPTGFLHIGGARTALFNWLYARRLGGKFHLRIEDTDRARSNQDAVDAIIKGMKWLGLDWDGDIVSQFEGANHHAEVANQLVEQGKAYHCFCSPEELEEMRETARKEGRTALYDGRWRDRDPSEAPKDIRPVVRLKTPVDGDTVVADMIQGDVRVKNSEIDDFVLLRADGTPTYMLAVVVDDHDMGVTHVIRGDDHLTNTFRQIQLYDAFGWDIPAFAHMPLMHGADGKKLSKRHGALGVEAYEEMGFLPEAICNYLLRLGWSHGDDEIISREQALEWFDIKDVGRSAARFDADKLLHLNAHYIREASDRRLVDLAMPLLKDRLGDALSDQAETRLLSGMDGLKGRARTIVELAESGEFYTRNRPIPINDKAAKLLDGEGGKHIASLAPHLEALNEWTDQTIDAAVREYAEKSDLKLGNIAQPLRAALTGSNVSPGIFEVMATLGKEESLGRLSDAISGRASPSAN